MNIKRSILKKCSAVLLTAAVMAVNISCEDKDDAAPVLSVTPSDRDIVFAADGVNVVAADGSVVNPNFTVETNQTEWDVSVASDETWLRIYRTGLHTFQLKPFPATGIVKPTPVEVIVTAGDAAPVRIAVQQLASAPSLAIMPLVTDETVIQFSADGTTAYKDEEVFTPRFTVVTNVGTWNASSSETWLTIVPDYENNSFTLEAVALSNIEELHEPATVTVRAGDAVPVTFTVTQSYVPLIDFSLSVKSILVIGNTYSVTVTLYPLAASILSPYQWRSLNTGVATVDEYGVVTAVSVGKTDIECTINGIVKTIAVDVVEEEQLDRLFFTRWNEGGIPYQALGGWEIESMWDGNLGEVNPGFSSPNNTLLPWSFTFDMGQMAKIKRIKIYPRLTASQEYVQSHPKKIQIYGSPTEDVTADFATWVYLGEFNSVKPSGLPAGQVTPEDTEYARAGEQFDATENTDVGVRYMRFHVEETWVMPNITIQIMELEIFGAIQE